MTPIEIALLAFMAVGTIAVFVVGRLLVRLFRPNAASTTNKKKVIRPHLATDLILWIGYFGLFNSLIYPFIVAFMLREDPNNTIDLQFLATVADTSWMAPTYLDWTWLSALTSGELTSQGLAGCLMWMAVLVAIALVGFWINLRNTRPAILGSFLILYLVLHQVMMLFLPFNDSGLLLGLLNGMAKYGWRYVGLLNVLGFTILLLIDFVSDKDRHGRSYVIMGAMVAVVFVLFAFQFYYGAVLQ